MQHQALCIISNASVNSNWSYSPETLNSGQNWRFFVQRDLKIWWMTLQNNRAPLLNYIKLCAAFQSHWYIQTRVTVRKRSIWVKIWVFCPRDLGNWQMTLKNYRAHSLYYIKLCVAFQSHWYIQSGVIVRKRTIRVKIGDFLSRVTLKIDAWPWKTMGHLVYTTSSFVHHFNSIGEFKLELQAGNAQYGSKSTFF